MKKKARVLFVSQEVTPYLDETPMSVIGRQLPQGIQERGKEIRTFMPKFGIINERRNQLHEVIRLSGMNLIIDNNDHPLIIKVASIQSARMQVYFIDNQEYFERKHILTDKKGEHFADNDERAIFFCRGVIETVKKLAPSAKYAKGNFSATLKDFNATLNSNNEPDYNSLNAHGELRTKNVTVGGYEPFVKLGDELKIEQLKTRTAEDEKIPRQLAAGLDGNVEIRRRTDGEQKEGEKLRQGAAGRARPPALADRKIQGVPG